MSAGTAAAIIGLALAGGLFVMLVGVASVASRKRRLPSTSEFLIILVAVGVAVVGIVCVVAPDAPAKPMLVTPPTYDPPRDLLSGEPL